MYRPFFASACALAAGLALGGPLGSSSRAQQLGPPNNPPTFGQVGQPPPLPVEPGEQPGGPAEALTRGPLHEGFAEPVPFNPRPGVVVPKQPPAPVEELAPEQRPAGDNVAWIPGYWSWDDERKDYLWISGIYRALPPNRQWVPGYWNRVDAGYQWVPGFWNSARANVEYFPTPPDSLEIGPSSEPPSVDQLWVPGCWMWRENRYAWRPGYWTPAQENWAWSPAHYAWTPNGCAFVSGFWDLPLERRGLLFAPVYFDPAAIVRPGFRYRPSVLIDLGVLTSHLFCRPAYHQYCFGDYYAARYAQAGIVPWFSYHRGHQGYCPIYAYDYWHHAHNHDLRWATDLRLAYEHRRDHVEARPARTFAAQQTLIRGFQNNNVIGNRNIDVRQMTLAQPFSRAVASRDGSLRLENVDRREQEQFRERTQEVRRFQAERGRLEASGINGVRDRSAGPARLDLRSPLAARSTTGGDPRQGDANAFRAGQRPGDTPFRADGNRRGEGIRLDDFRPRSDARDPGPRSNSSGLGAIDPARSFYRAPESPSSGPLGQRGPTADNSRQRGGREGSSNSPGSLPLSVPRTFSGPTPPPTPHSQQNRPSAPLGNFNPSPRNNASVKPDSAPPRTHNSSPSFRSSPSPTPRPKADSPAPHGNSRSTSMGSHNAAPHRASGGTAGHKAEARSSHAPKPAPSKNTATARRHSGSDNNHRRK